MTFLTASHFSTSQNLYWLEKAKTIQYFVRIRSFLGLDEWLNQYRQTQPNK